MPYFFFFFLQQPVLIKSCGELYKRYRPYCCMPEGVEVSFLCNWLIAVVISTQSTWKFLFCSLNEVMLTKALHSRICNTFILWSILLWFQTLYTGFKRKFFTCIASFLFYVFIQKYNYVELMGPFYLKGYQNSVNNLPNRLCVMVMEVIFSLKSMKIILVDA